MFKCICGILEVLKNYLEVVMKMAKTISVDEICKKFYGDKKVAVITGAGVSVASGIRPFRGEGGLYNENKEAIRKLSLRYFLSSSQGFYKFYRENFLKPNDGPNIVHQVLAELQKEGYIEGIITQNIDTLHTLAGSENVIEIHGTGDRYYCINCKASYTKERYSKDYVCEKCGGAIRPDMTFYEEPPKEEDRISAYRLLIKADIIFILGTSFDVNTILNLLGKYEYYKRVSKKDYEIIIVNKDKTDYDYLGRVCYMDLSKLFDEVKKYGIEKAYLGFNTLDEKGFTR